MNGGWKFRATPSRNAPNTGADLLTEKQRQRLESLFAGDEHVEIEATWGIYQRMITAPAATPTAPEVERR
jgi:hypothetical protein